MEATMKKNIIKIITITVLLFAFNASVSAQCTDYVKIKGRNFYIEDTEYYPVGVNYLVDVVADSVTHDLYIAPHHCYGTSNNYESFNATSSLQEIREDFYRIKNEMGMNSIRLFGLGPLRNPSSNGFYFKANINLLSLHEDSVDTVSFSPPYSANPAVNSICAQYFVFIDSILAIAAEPDIGIRVILLAGGGGIFSSSGREDYADYLAVFAANFANDTTLFAYDVSNEPGGTGNDGGYVTYKEDVCSATLLWYDSIKTYAPCQLVTFGDRYAEDVMKFDPDVMHLDFISFHPYPVVTDPTDSAEVTLGIDRVLSQIFWYANNVSLPWMLGEIGFSAKDGTLSPTSHVDGSYNDQGNFAALTLAKARSCGAAGYTWWQYQNVNWGTEPIDILNNNLGLIDYNDSLKNPAVNAFLAFDTNYVQTSCTQPDYYYNPYNHPENLSQTITGTISDQDNALVNGAYLLGWTELGWLYDTTVTPHVYIYQSDVHYTFSKEDGTFDLIPYGDTLPAINNPYPEPSYPAGTGDIVDIKISALGAESIEYGWNIQNPIPLNDIILCTLKRINPDVLESNQTVSFGHSEIYQAKHILTTSDIEINFGATAEFKATKEVHITPDFIAHYGSEVHIYCAPVFFDCDSFSLFQVKQRLTNPYVTQALEKETAKSIEVNFKNHILNSITVSPNPSTGNFLVELNSNDGNLLIKTISVYDITGRKVMAVEIDVKSYILNLTTLPKGIYFLHATDANIQYNKKIIIN